MLSASPSDAVKTLEEAEEEADRIALAGGREYSQSIIEAQSRLHVWLPTHLQEDKEGHLHRAQVALAASKVIRRPNQSSQGKSEPINIV